MNYFEKYLKYKNKYLQFKSNKLFSNQIGKGKPFITNTNINFFNDDKISDFLNPIYGLIMCESGYISNNYYLRENRFIYTEESRIIKKISNTTFKTEKNNDILTPDQLNKHLHIYLDNYIIILNNIITSQKFIKNTKKHLYNSLNVFLIQKPK